MPGLVDMKDVPVVSRYVDATVATGAELVVKSSWLNAVSVIGSREELERVAALPFVDRLEPVRRGEVQDEAKLSTPSGGWRWRIHMFISCLPAVTVPPSTRQRAPGQPVAVIVSSR